MPRSLTMLVALFMLPLGAADAQDLPRVPRHDRDAIEVGTHRARGGVDFGQARGVVDAPFDEVLGIVHDYANYRQFMPHFKTSRVLAQRGQRAMVYMEVGILRDTVTLWAQVRISSRQDGDTTVVEASMTEGNMETFRAVWELRPLANGSRTLARFRLLVDPDLPAVPNSIITAENANSARKSIVRLRRRVLAIRG